MNMDNEQKINLALALGAIGTILSIFLLASGAHIQPPETGPDAFYRSQAREYGIRKSTFNTCIEDPSIEARVDEEINEAARLGGQGTPFNVIVSESGQMVALPGAYPYQAFMDIINRMKAGELTAEELGSIPEGASMRGFSKERDYFKGNADAPITIFEYSDYECPYCASVHSTLQQVVDTNEDVKWVYRHLPLSFHEQAKPAAIAALCIGKEAGNEGFWGFTDAVFEDQSLLEE